jgi:hypothetical protein
MKPSLLPLGQLLYEVIVEAFSWAGEVFSLGDEVPSMLLV